MCYMNEYDVSKQKATEEIHKVIENEWKHINEDLMKPMIGAKILPKILINLARVSDYTYNGGVDLFTDGSKTKDSVISLFIEPLPI